MELLIVSVGSEGGTRRSHAGLVAGVDRSRVLAADPDRLRAIDEKVSGWSVGQHVEHLWLADSGICRWIERVLEDPDVHPRAGTPSTTGRAVLLSGWIPRGKAKAPESSVPGSTADDGLPQRLTRLHGFIEGIEPRLAELHVCTSTLEHPILGYFTPAQWLRFLDVHHRHHEKIIRDIGA